MAKKSLEKFISETIGTQVDIPWADGRLKGQCVSLIQQYIGQCLEQPMRARGNAVDWIETYVNEGLGTKVADQKVGDILVFPHEADGYGHIAIYTGGEDLYDQNNGRHDNYCAGYGKIFSWDFVTLRPNTEVIVNEPRPVEEPKQEETLNKECYLNLNSDIDEWRVYPMDVAPVKGNECKIIKPSKFSGLSYTLQGYSQQGVAIINTRDFGQVQIYIGAGTEGKYSITNEPIYGLVK